MAIQVEEAGPCKMVVKVEVSAEEMEKRLEEKLREFQKTAHLKGFRPGHAPRHLIERLYLKDILEDLKSAVVEETLTKAVEENELRLVGEPKLGDVEFERGKSLQYQAEIFVLPKVTPPPYKGIKVKAPDPTPSEKEVDAEIERLRKSRGQLSTVTDRETRPDDRLVVSMSVTTEDGEQLFKTDHGYIAVGMKTLFGVDVEELPKLLEGKKVGDEVEFEFVVTEDSSLAGEEKKHAGKKVRCSVKIKEIRAIAYPDVNDELAKAFGFETMEKMRKAIKERLLVTRRIKVEEEMEERLIATLLENLKVDLPQELLKEKAEVFAEYLRVKLKADKPDMSEDELAAQVEKAKKERHEELENRLRRQLLVDAIAKAEKIFVTEDEVNDVIRRLAVANNIAAADLRQQMIEAGQLSELRFELLEAKVKRFLREKSQITYEGDKWKIELPKPKCEEAKDEEADTGTTNTDSD